MADAKVVSLVEMRGGLRVDLKADWKELLLAVTRADWRVDGKVAVKAYPSVARRAMLMAVLSGAQMAAL